MNFTIREKDKKYWYYFQRFIQYGYFVVISLYYIISNMSYSCQQASLLERRQCTGKTFDLVEILGYVIIGMLVIYWHKNTKKYDKN